jgi:hypothetical protein
MHLELHNVKGSLQDYYLLSSNVMMKNIAQDFSLLFCWINQFKLYI